MPGLGNLVNSFNIIAVKFDEDLINSVKNKTQKLNFTKKNILLNLNMDNAQKTYSYNCKTPFKNIELLKAKTSLITKCEKSAKDYLLKNYSINLKKYPEHIIKTIENKSLTPRSQFKFLEEKRKKQINPKTNSSFTLSFLDEDILKSVEYFKGIMIKYSKNCDKKGNGIITKSEMVEVLIKSNIDNKIDLNKAKLIVDYLNKTDKVEYMKFIALFIKKCKLALLHLDKNKKSINSNFNSLNLNETNYDNFRREKFFNTINSNRFYQKNDKNQTKKNNYLNNNYNQTLPNFNKTLNNFRRKNLDFSKEEEEKNRINSLDEEDKNKSFNNENNRKINKSYC